VNLLYRKEDSLGTQFREKMERNGHFLLAGTLLGLLLVQRLRKRSFRQKEKVKFRLRPFSEFQAHHYDQLVDSMADGSIAAATLLIPFPYTMEDAKWFVKFASQSSGEFFFIEVDGNYAGACGVHLVSTPSRQHTRSMGYHLSPKYRGSGLMTEVVKELLVKVKENYPECLIVEADTFEHNEKSARVLEKNGFTMTGILPGYYIKNGVVLNARHFVKKLL
jgi:[ribosomal protein S5]-alanine N-acetyltransferase